MSDKKIYPADTVPAVGSESDKPDLVSHFVRQTDATFAGKPDKSLIGRDIPIEEYDEDELDEDGEPL